MMSYIHVEVLLELPFFQKRVGCLAFIVRLKVNRFWIQWLTSRYCFLPEVFGYEAIDNVVKSIRKPGGTLTIPGAAAGARGVSAHVLDCTNQSMLMLRSKLNTNCK